MKLIVNPKELLALHNLLRDATEVPPTKYGDGDPVPDDTHLRQLYGRVRACLVSALATKKVDDPVEAFLSQEQAKIDKLKVELVDVKKDQAGLAVALKGGGHFLVPEDDEDLQAPEYPRKTARRAQSGGNGHRGGKK